MQLIYSILFLIFTFLLETQQQKVNYVTCTSCIQASDVNNWLFLFFMNKKKLLNVIFYRDSDADHLASEFTS